MYNIYRSPVARLFLKNTDESVESPANYELY